MARWIRGIRCASYKGTAPAEIDLLGGGTRVAEAGGLELEPRLMIPCKIGYNTWIILLEPLGRHHAWTGSAKARHHLEGGQWKSIRIWRDPWIPRELSLRVTTRQGRCRLKWVSELLDLDGREWDFDKLIHIFNPEDVEEISKIKIPAPSSEAFIAQHMEKTGIFTVRSAYNLALRIKRGQDLQSSSSAPDGERRLWSGVWSGQVPPKVNVFIWKLARDSLPTRRAKFILRLEHSDICPLCDREPETSYHATVTCPWARNLRLAMREHWRLPEEQFQYTGPDWLLLLLDRCSAAERDLTKLLLWKTWSVDNNITHQSGPMSIPEAVHALCAMQATLADILSGDAPVAGKGKLPCSSSDNRKQTSAGSKELGRTAWEPPPAGWTKVNVDGSFVSQSGEAGIGIIARDCKRQVIFMAWCVQFRCHDALEAEAQACLKLVWRGSV
ncbi:hypothetical protein C2845_PM02G17800 [Panicum miliaceum]|uniref:Reverse transcriptase zinc-binding domain-containing protein n=1 Tax=Panicum miliaceum TaxID=4540 RepID=A0A3L6S6H1_PANMI|nr:hypothetical protein C2845_PM02G17800 [Panicum miliaceum]